ncbi:MAG: hydroxymethylbilane synthase [Fibrobacter sp.]|uniref:hydroxymethylbilane synthase n=1 Tax=Fibrobacter sp. TaxID=35828 RepID=UPI0025C10658|nr:hydroxymethylbilane synthase [Fibrobacter sp.]MBR4785377.1 hydroxymethylbilane synthase [Fibrobacter sp.]
MGNALLRVATRQSALALAQTKMAADAIAAVAGIGYELVPMTTEGDRRLDKSLASFGGKGVFIKELEVALLEGRADIAVHSLKDMPAEVLPEFKLAAVLEREDPRDAFIARGGAEGTKFMDLPAGARVGTGSIRRVVQLKALRPDIEYVPIRGNIQTRLSKLEELDGVVLAAAGLKRMGLADRVTEYFDTEKVLPASGQGILAIETLSPSAIQEPQSGDRIQAILSRVNHAPTYCIAVAEMAFLKALNAGCQFPVASFAEFASLSGKNEFANDSQIQNASQIMKIRGIYWDEASRRLLRAEHQCPMNSGMSDEGDFADAVNKARELGIALAEKIKNEL